MIKKLLALLAAVSMGSGGALAQIGPGTNGPFYSGNFYQGFVPTAQFWNLLESNKIDYNPSGLPIQYGGTGATTAAQAAINLGFGGGPFLPLAGGVGTGQWRAVAGSIGTPGLAIGETGTGFFFQSGHILGTTMNGVQLGRSDAAGNFVWGAGTPAAGGSITTGTGNFVFGPRAGAFLSSATDQFIAGHDAGLYTTTGGSIEPLPNVFIGYTAGKSTNEGGNVSIGANSLTGNSAISSIPIYSSTAVGENTLSSVVASQKDTAVGSYALNGYLRGGQNAAFGRAALAIVVESGYAVGIGHAAGFFNVATFDSILIGNSSGAPWPGNAPRITASQSGGTLTVTSFTGGDTPLDIGMQCVSTAVAALPSNIVISSFGTGSGGTGTYTVTPSQTVSSQTMRCGAYGTQNIILGLSNGSLGYGDSSNIIIGNSLTPASASNITAIGKGQAAAYISGNLSSSLTASAISNAAGVAYTAAQMRGGLINRSGATTVSDTTTTALAIATSIPGAEPGASFDLYIANSNSGALTISGGTGVTVSGSASVVAGGTGHFKASVGTVGATFTGTGSGTNLTISGVTGTIAVGNTVTGTGVPGSTTIVSQTSGVAGGAGVYVTSNATTSSAASLTIASSVTLQGFSSNAAVASVFGRTGAVVAASNDYSFAQLSGSYTLAQGPTIGASTVLGSVAGGTPAALTQAQLTALINAATASLPGALPAWPNNTTTFFRGDGTYATLNVAAVSGAAPLASPTFTGTVTGPDATTWSSTGFNFGINGSVGTPAIGRGSSGMYFSASGGNVNFTVAGTQVVQMQPGLVSIAVGNSFIANGDILTASYYRSPNTGNRYYNDGAVGVHQFTNAGTANYVNLTITTSNAGALNTMKASGPFVMSGGYTVAGLPASPGTGAHAYVTDQLTTCAVVGAALTGGGAVTCPAFYNGSAWVGG